MFKVVRLCHLTLENNNFETVERFWAPENEDTIYVDAQSLKMACLKIICANSRLNQENIFEHADWFFVNFWSTLTSCTTGDEEFIDFETVQQVLQTILLDGSRGTHMNSLALDYGVLNAEELQTYNCRDGDTV